MVRVFYEPRPYGPTTDLMNRSGYGVHGGGLFKGVLERASKAKPIVAMGLPIIAIMGLCYLPVGE